MEDISDLKSHIKYKLKLWGVILFWITRPIKKLLPRYLQLKLQKILTKAIIATYCGKSVKLTIDE